jgi:hypothetical protein
MRCYFRDGLDTSTGRSHVSRARFFTESPFRPRGRTCKMRQLRSLLRTTLSRIGRRLALIVAIAAASLPAAGA